MKTKRTKKTKTTPYITKKTKPTQTRPTLTSRRTRKTKKTKPNYQTTTEYYPQAYATSQKNWPANIDPLGLNEESGKLTSLFIIK